MAKYGSAHLLRSSETATIANSSAQEAGLRLQSLQSSLFGLLPFLRPWSTQQCAALDTVLKSAALRETNPMNPGH
jgi:hypothetical protein